MITSQCNAGADALQVHMQCVVTLGEARQEYFSQCWRNCGAIPHVVRSYVGGSKTGLLFAM